MEEKKVEKREKIMPMINVKKVKNKKSLLLILCLFSFFFLLNKNVNILNLIEIIKKL